MLVELVHVVVHCVRTHDLVRHVSTQHDILLILQNGGDETWPQVKPGGGGGGRGREGEGEGEGEGGAGREMGEIMS